ncbi:MAG: exo-alpha-sialidase, partial [Anaerolineae bacterium]
MKYTFSFFLVFALVLSSWQLAHGQASPWSEPYTFEQSGWFPGITTDFSGRVHLFWSQSRYYGLTPPDSRPTSGYDVVYYTSKTTREAWSPVTDIIAIPQYNIGSVEVTRPNPWAAPDGTLHLTYRNLDVFYTRALAWEAASPGAWHKASRLNIRNLGYFSDVIQDSRGRLHAVYTENQPDENCRLCYHLFYRYSDDEGQTWSLPFDLSALKAPPLGAAKPQLFLDEQENLHVIWESGAGGTLGGVVEPVHILHAVSFDSGQTWPIVHVLSQAGEHTARNPALAQDRQGRLVAVWMDSGANQVVYRISATHGRSWEPPHTIANVAAERQIHNTRQSAYALVGDSAGNLHLLMIGSLPEQSTSLAVLHLTWT